MNKRKKHTFNFEQLAEAFRKEIEEYGALLILIYEQQNCLAEHNPISLLKLPAVFNTLYFCESTEAIISFVLVFPTLPVIPTTLISSDFR